jgi:GH18 family chitinase
MKFYIIAIFLSIIGYIDCTCNYIVQSSGQYCWDLAQICKIDVSLLYKYNPSLGSDCSGLIAGQKVCCSPGGIAPNPGGDGSCYSYKVQAGDYCNKIAADFGITLDKLLQYNTQTWGWLGCDNIQLDQNICVSSGTPPRPTSDPAATCGKTAPGNLYDTPCALNACCSQWGYCGMGEEFCATSSSATNNPGTTGCQSHCEMGYTANTGPPSQFIKLGYYETWNSGRDCLNMDIPQLQAIIDSEKYTHIHYAFGVISDYHPFVEDQTMWNNFLGLKNVKKIISFGGWSFSTEDATRPIFGDSVLTNQFVNNLVDMVKQYNLDGVDIDWEYPGATDLKGWADSTPTVHPNDGENYVNFLSRLRAAMPSQYSVSICAPASFWYLKNFPIAQMNQYLTYIVFMTYDLHGQWDINIESLGPKLLSHVSKPETINALAMITKAGMDSNKVLMGVASYGRAFWQSDPNCSGPTCTFTSHGATPGRCTKESSYVGYGEIEEIIKSGKYRSMYYDSESDSDILLYGTNDWVAYTNISTTMNGRYEMARSMNLGGTVEWAIDLRATTGSIVGDEEIIYSVEYMVTEKDCPNNIATIEQAMGLNIDCMYYGLVQALWHIMADSILSYNSMLDNKYNYLYSEKYLPYAIDSGNREHIIFWDSATIENNDISSSFDKYVSCGGDCVQGGAVQLKYSMGDITKAFSSFMDSGYVMNIGDFDFPYSYVHDGGKNIIKYSNFPMIDKENTYIDPSKDIDASRDSINKMSSMLTDVFNNPQNYDHEDVVDAVMYNVITLSSGVDGMKQIMDIGNKIVEQEQKAAANFILNIIMMLIEVIVAFVPVVGPLLSTTIGLVYSIATGSTDPIDYIFAAAGAIGDIGSMFKVGKSFGEIATLTKSLKVGTTSKSLKHLDLNNLKIINTNKVKELGSICKI